MGWRRAARGAAGHKCSTADFAELCANRVLPATIAALRHRRRLSASGATHRSFRDPTGSRRTATSRRPRGDVSGGNAGVVYRHLCVAVTVTREGVDVDAERRVWVEMRRPSRPRAKRVATVRFVPGDGAKNVTQDGKGAGVALDQDCVLVELADAQVVWLVERRPEGSFWTWHGHSLPRQSIPAPSSDPAAAVSFQVRPMCRFSLLARGHSPSDRVPCRSLSLALSNLA